MYPCKLKNWQFVNKSIKESCMILIELLRYSVFSSLFSFFQPFASAILQMLEYANQYIVLDAIVSFLKSMQDHVFSNDSSFEYSIIQ